eukprot:4837738-Amphidinium_carterae.1
MHQVPRSSLSHLLLFPFHYGWQVKATRAVARPLERPRSGPAKATDQKVGEVSGPAIRVPGTLHRLTLHNGALAPQVKAASRRDPNSRQRPSGRMLMTQ